MLISFNDIKGNVGRYLARQKQKVTCIFYIEIRKFCSTPIVQQTTNI